MAYIPGVHLLPSTGEFTYDTVPYLGARSSGSPLLAVNTYCAPGGAKTDYSYALDQLQAAHPECRTVSIVCAWFCDGLTAGSCNIYPSTTYIGGAFHNAETGSDSWRCSGLTQTSPGLIPIPTNPAGSFIYGGTPSDQSIVRCIRDLKARGFQVIFYPFLLVTSSGLPWRGLITYAPDLSIAATNAVTTFYGSANASQFTRDASNLTVSYSGSATDWSYRRMILHYANLCVLAGGVNLFVLGSELRGLETLRGPSWSSAGATDDSGFANWDYPFVSGLATLAADVRSIFDGASLLKSTSDLTNLVTYSADWTSWMGYQHPGSNGQWPHLDSLWRSSAIDFVSFDNYLPLSDWTTDESGQDVSLWREAPPNSWPPTDANGIGLGLTGAPSLYSKPYLKANMEGGEKFHWFYTDGDNGGAGLDPNGSGLYVSLPFGDRRTQSRQRYYPDQQILANKQLRWWWNNSHYAVYDNGDGSGWSPHGPDTGWTPQSKPILFLEYGVPCVDRGSNQPNVFYDPNSVESDTPYWSAWDPVSGGGLAPRRDDTLSGLALDAIYEYWNTDGHNSVVGDVIMVQFALSCVWNWDARPFPTFPLLSHIWGDAAQWQWGNWLNGKGPSLPPSGVTAYSSPSNYPTFPALLSQGWSTRISPRFSTTTTQSVSGKERRYARRWRANYEIELTIDVLRAAAPFDELSAIAGFFTTMQGAEGLFWIAPPGLTDLSGQPLGIGDGATTNFPLQASWPGGYIEPVLGTTGVSAIYLNATYVENSPGANLWVVTAGYAPSIEFTTAPPAGSLVSADFGPLWLCRFSDDLAKFENFMTNLWRFEAVKLQTVRP